MPMNAISSLAQGYALGSAIRKRFEERKEKGAKREVLSRALDLPTREYTMVTPSDRGMAFKPEEQQISLPESIVWEEQLKKMLEMGVDPDKALDFVNTNRRKTVEQYFNRALLTIKTNPQIAAQSLMKAYAHAGMPVYIRPDENGNLVAFAADPETGKIDPTPKLINEDYLYKLKKLYQDKYNFGKEAADARYKNALADYYKVKPAIDAAGKRAAVKPHKVDWEETNTLIKSVFDNVAQGYYGKEIMQDFADNPVLQTQMFQFARDLAQLNPTMVGPDGREISVNPTIYGEIALGLVYGDKVKGAPIEKVRFNVKTGRLQYGEGPTAITMTLPASIRSKIRRIMELANQPKPKPDEGRRAALNTVSSPGHRGKTAALQEYENLKGSVESQLPPDTRKQLLDEFFKRYGGKLK